MSELKADELEHIAYMQTLEIQSLNARIAELEHDLTNKEIEYTDLWDDALAFQARIAELEAAQVKAKNEIYRLNRRITELLEVQE